MSPLAVALVAVVLSAGGLGFALGHRRPTDIRLRALKEHAKLLRKARWASLVRKDGLANIYSEAAARVLDVSEDD